MKKLSLLKRCLACAITAVLCMGIFSYTSQNSENYITVSAESEEKKQNEENISNTQKTLDELLKKQKDLDGQINATQGDISKEEENQKAIQSQIETVQKTILALEDSIKELNGQISVLQTDINTSEAKILEKRKEIDQGTEDFKKRLRALYIVGDSSYSSMIAGATDFYDMLMKVELVKRVASHDNKMIDNLISLKAQYEEDKKVLEQKKNDLEGKKSKLVSQQKDLVAQVDKLQKLMEKSKALVDELEKRKAAYEANKKSIDAEQDKFEAEMQKLLTQRKEIAAKEEAERIRKEQEEAARRAAEAAAAAERARQAAIAEQQKQQQQQQGGSSSGGSSTPSYTEPTYRPGGSGKLAWPVPGYYAISYGYGYRNAGSLTGFHKGIDISSWGIMGRNITAAAAGTVILVENSCTHNYAKNGSCGCGGGYGRYCIIDHGNGMWTLYGHATNISVVTNQHVEAGQVLGQVGTTGWSTGPHLHFEVRINGTAVNPIGYL
ncbi:MAG: peptidoglycan DD-metalloendopeptidase family protein [Ruminococcus sp.]|nr:peptidoglycan DD-metalloendopeptidase family protein [Ruminococcus sp.]